MGTETITISKAEYERLTAQVATLQQENIWLIEQIRLARKQRFGPSSEKTATDEGMVQLSYLFNEPECMSRESAPEADVEARLRDYEMRGIIRGYQAVINTDLLEDDSVRAVIELRIRPTQDGGFDRIANRIGRFDEVESMYLMSGSYDLLLFVKGRNLREVGRFVSSKLANMEGVLSTATHFMLKTYKDQGVMLEQWNHDERLQVSP